MTDELTKLEKDLTEFSHKVDQCQESLDMTDIKDAYAGMHRTRDRFERRARYLSPSQTKALAKHLRYDVFIESMGKVRSIGEHVDLKDDVELHHSDGSAFTMTPASSSAVIFATPRVMLTDKTGKLQTWDHPKNLAEARDRITRAFKKAKDS
jgi:hypothetical protein